MKSDLSKRMSEFEGDPQSPEIVLELLEVQISHQNLNLPIAAFGMDQHLRNC